MLEKARLSILMSENERSFGGDSFPPVMTSPKSGSSPVYQETKLDSSQ